MLNTRIVSTGIELKRVLSGATLAVLLCLALLLGNGFAVAQTEAIPLPPPAKPNPNAPVVEPEEPIINLLDREPEPLFADTLVPYAPARSATTGISGGLQQGALYLMAKLTSDSKPLNDGLIWRIYSETTNADGRLQLVATHKGGDAEFRLDPGTYLIHTAYGYAQRSTASSWAAT